MPDDDRAQEIGYAASFMVLVGSDFSWEGVGQVMHYDTTIPTVIGAVTAAAVAIDVWKRSGCTSKMVLNGMNRLFLKDVERESRAEAGAFLTAYMTGLPCFAFQPSAVEALRCVYPTMEGGRHCLCYSVLALLLFSHLPPDVWSGA